MKPETILSAMEKALHYSYENKYHHDRKNWNIRNRQYHAFRARILRMFEELQEEMKASDEYVDEAQELIEQHYETIQEKDKRIAELDEEKAMETYRYVELASVNDRLEKRIAELEAMIDDIASQSHV